MARRLGLGDPAAPARPAGPGRAGPGPAASVRRRMRRPARSVSTSSSALARRTNWSRSLCAAALIRIRRRHGPPSGRCGQGVTMTWNPRASRPSWIGVAVEVHTLHLSGAALGRERDGGHRADHRVGAGAWVASAVHSRSRPGGRGRGSAAGAPAIRRGAGRRGPPAPWARTARHSGRGSRSSPTRAGTGTDRSARSWPRG